MKFCEEVPGYVHYSNFGAFDESRMRAWDEESLIAKASEYFHIPKESILVLKAPNQSFSTFSVYITDEHRETIEAWQKNIREMLELLKLANGIKD